MPQLYLVPVRPSSSRSTHNSGVSASTSTSWLWPLTLMVNFIRSPASLFQLAVEEVERARPRQLGVRFVVDGARRVGEAVIGFVPIDRARLAGVGHRLLESGDHVVVDHAIERGEMPEHVAGQWLQFLG